MRILRSIVLAATVACAMFAIPSRASDLNTVNAPTKLAAQIKLALNAKNDASLREAAKQLAEALSAASDINASGAINAQDLTAAKARSGQIIP